MVVGMCHAVVNLAVIMRRSIALRAELGAKILEPPLLLAVAIEIGRIEPCLIGLAQAPAIPCR